MRILFTDDIEYNDDNSSENIEFIMKDKDNYFSPVSKPNHIHSRINTRSDNFHLIYINEKSNIDIREYKFKSIYPISQIKRIIP